MVWSFCNVWDPVGDAKVSQLFVFLMGETGLESISNHLEYGLGLFNVVSLVGV